jgi:hypothetical protein
MPRGSTASDRDISLKRRSIAPFAAPLTRNNIISSFFRRLLAQMSVRLTSLPAQPTLILARDLARNFTSERSVIARPISNARFPLRKPYESGGIRGHDYHRGARRQRGAPISSPHRGAIEATSMFDIPPLISTWSISHGRRTLAKRRSRCSFERATSSPSPSLSSLSSSGLISVGIIAS